MAEPKENPIVSECPLSVFGKLLVGRRRYRKASLFNLKIDLLKFFVEKNPPPKAVEEIAESPECFA